MKNSVCREEELARLRQRYAGRGRGGKGRLLDEFCEQYDYDRKHAIKLLGDWFQPGHERTRSGPAKKYEGITEVLERVWRSSEQLCGKRLAPALDLWLPHYHKHFEALSLSQKKLLKEVSPATIDRVLADRKGQGLRGLNGTRPGTLLRQQLPIQGEVWNEKRPGFLEADSVAHCGTSLAGDFIWSLVYTCLGSAWTEGRAVWNRGATGVLEQTKDVEQNLPFKLRGMDFDNGGEWLNWTLVRYLQDRIAPVRLTRSRPYHSDDNAHVEQKNWMWPRQLLGYARLEDQSVLPRINALYKELWGPLQNFFLPSMKLKDKHREGSKWVRQHDRPQTAYQRLAASGELESKHARYLKDWYQSLDPFALSAQIEVRLKPILKTARVAPPRPAQP